MEREQHSLTATWFGDVIVAQEDAPLNWTALVYIGAASLVFALNNEVVLKKIVPASVRARTPYHTRRWRNVANSFTHSCITGVGAILSFWATPTMSEDLIKTHSFLSHRLVCISIGYFLVDFADLLLSNKNRSGYELLVHHAFVVVCFGIAAFTEFYVGFAMAALLAEVNSIFLHARQLMQIQGYQKDGVVYKTNSLINIGTFVAFRIITFSWMTRWLAINRDAVPLPSYTIGCVGLATIVAMNIVLFIRIIKADFKLEGRRGVMKLIEEDQINKLKTE